jgi:hypothetical protein
MIRLCSTAAKPISSFPVTSSAFIHPDASAASRLATLGGSSLTGGGVAAPPTALPSLRTSQVARGSSSPGTPRSSCWSIHPASREILVIPTTRRDAGSGAS